MALKVAMISEKLGTKDSKDSTIICKEALARGHKVYEIRPRSISYNDGKLLARADIYTAAEDVEAPQDSEIINLAEVDIIHFRPNPPVDMGYLTTTYLLDRIKDKVLIINNPEAIIKFPEKIFPIMFKEFMPPTLITYSAEEMAEFAEKHKDIVTKPLYEYGGNGVKKLNAQEAKNGIDTISQWIGELKTPAIAQKFLPNVVKGDKRIYFIAGEIAGAFMRVPKEGDFLANTIWGSKLEKTEVTPREQELAKRLKPVLLENGIYICGIDVIDDFVTEINITSPAGIGFSKLVYNSNPEAQLWDFIEDKLK